jgi:hypothetical protein
MLRSLSRDIFEFRLMSGNINGVYNLDTTPALEDFDEIIEERVPNPRPPRKKRQKVYALLDVSNSMRDDNKIIFAKALLLAYMVMACEEGAQIYFRTFGNTVHARTDALSREAFPALARRLLDVTPDGSTDIKGALDMAIGDIRALDNLNRYEGLFESPPTEILLVSDCESYTVPFIPRGIKLHTVHLEAGRMMTAYRDGFERIREASATFNQIDTSALQLPDSTRERWLLQQDGRSLETLPPPAVRDGDRSEKPRVVINRRTLMEVYERMDDTTRRTGAVRAPAQGIPLRPHLGLLHIIRDWIARRFHHSRRPATRHASAVLGVQFRERR